MGTIESMRKRCGVRLRYFDRASSVGNAADGCPIAEVCGSFHSVGGIAPGEETNASGASWIETGELQARGGASLFIFDDDKVGIIVGICSRGVDCACHVNIASSIEREATGTSVRQQVFENSSPKFRPIGREFGRHDSCLSDSANHPSGRIDSALGINCQAVKVIVPPRGEVEL